MPTLKGKQRRYLRGLAHRLQPVVIVGRRGVTEAVIHQIDAALRHHELIKVKLTSERAGERENAARSIAEQTACEIIGLVGRVLILYRRDEDDPRISLPQ